MTKTKTKRTIWTALIIVVAFVVAAIFYTQSTKSENVPAPVEDVKTEETIKAADQAIENTDKVVADQTDTSTKTNTLEYVSEYQKTKSGFNALGVSWEEFSAKATDITFYIRAKNNGSETPWYMVEKMLEESIGGVAYYAAETPVMIEGDEYQYKISFSNKLNEVRNIEFNILNTDGATETNLFQKLSKAIWGTSEAVAAPTVISRSGWGSGAPNNTKTELQAYIDRYDMNYNVNDLYWPAAHASKSTKFIVHHTAGANNPSNPAAAVRAIWVYHTFSRGWGDIGYNYLVDQYGVIYEGRYGGAHVIAGHSAPYNYDEANDAASVGVSVLGDFTSVAPNNAIKRGLAKIIGYKSYLYNINPKGVGYFEDKYTYNVAGHRNYTSTACPGTYLYSALSTIRQDSYDYMGIFGHTIQGLAVSNPAPVAGETINGSFVIKNSKTTNTTLESLKISGVYGSTIVDFPVVSNVALAPAGQEGDSYSYLQSKVLATGGSYVFTVKYKEGGVWYSAIASSGVSSLTVSVYGTPANVKLSTSLKTNPEFPVANQTVYGAFELVNTGDQPANYDRVKIIVRNQAGDQVYQNWALSDVVVKGKSTYKFYKGGILPQGDIDYNIEFLNEDGWQSFSKVTGVVDSGLLKVYPTQADLKISEQLQLSESIFLGSKEVSATFKVTNYGTQPVRLDKLGVFVKKDARYNMYFPFIENVVLCSALDTASYCDYKGSLQYSKSMLFSATGSYKMLPTSMIGGVWTGLATDPGVSLYDYLSVGSINYKNITLDMIRASDSYPALGQEVTLRYRIRNLNSYAVTLSRVKLVGRLSNNRVADTPGFENVVVGAGDTMSFEENVTVSSSLQARYKIAYQAGSIWSNPTIVSSHSGYIYLTPHYPVLRLSQSLSVNPTSGLSGSTFTTTFKLKNYEDAPVFVKEIRTSGKVGTRTYGFPSVDTVIAAGGTYSYNQSAVISRGVDHSSWASFKYANGLYMNAIPIAGVTATKNFKVYITVATIDGVPLPATTGKTAREQHLNLVAGCNNDNYLAVRESRAHHYTTSGTPLAAQNGMAWETSGGCGYGAWGVPASVANERYYINMRWNYTTLHGQTVLATKSWYYGKRIVITNPTNGKKVVAAIVEYGPGVLSRVSGLSPEAMLAIGAVTDNTLNYAWAADQNMPLGLVN